MSAPDYISMLYLSAHFWTGFQRWFNQESPEKFDPQAWGHPVDEMLSQWPAAAELEGPREYFVDWHQHGRMAWNAGAAKGKACGQEFAAAIKEEKARDGEIFRLGPIQQKALKIFAPGFDYQYWENPKSPWRQDIGELMGALGEGWFLEGFVGCDGKTRYVVHEQERRSGHLVEGTDGSPIFDAQHGCSEDLATAVLSAVVAHRRFRLALAQVQGEEVACGDGGEGAAATHGGGLGAAAWNPEDLEGGTE